MKPLNSLKTNNFIQRLQWVFDPIQYMETNAQHHQDIFTTSVAGRLIFVNSPEGIQKLLTHDTKEFSAPGSVNGILRPLLGDQSVILLDGDRHKRQRKLLMPPFHGDRMRNYGELILKITQQATEKWKPGQPLIARNTMREITLAVILQAVFGIYEGSRYDELKQLIASLLAVTDSPISSSLLFFQFLQKDWGAWSPWGRFLRMRQKIDQLLFAEIEDRRQNWDENRTDILNLMMAARDEDGQPMSDEELRDELLTLLFAGHETTATAMAWALYWIHRQPEVYQKLIQELETLPENPDPMTIFRLPYLTAVCNETLRIYPVGMLTFPRMVHEPMEFMGYQLEPGMSLVGCIYLLHHREDLYPEPKQFKPERFLERKFSPYEFSPFGAGARQCIGMALAQFEMKLALAYILQNYHLTLLENHPVKPARRGVTLSPVGGIKMMMNGRRTPSKSVAIPATV
ncbi:cytochrome P450 [Limnoraphis robusta Tam1]|uniref:cytochrome P450 n=1 Tax=Limnoraphis robusta TaxID=1118279 RepID=UPI002B1F2A2E|nr:cytochrome P450 [Limnoraphis robusta]MEA5499637.1 cytochrome P450 [Limnoraphis robusta BA-68 BA1]MEA5541056.1 cytochrome P450 [Limnoraphis robusta Tam1]